MGKTKKTQESRVAVFKAQDIALPVSRKMAEDPFKGLYGDRILEPPYNLDYLARLPEESNVLSQCIEAMEMNIAGIGFTLEPRDGAKDNGGTVRKEAEDERKKILHFFEFCNQGLHALFTGVQPLYDLLHDLNELVRFPHIAADRLLIVFSRIAVAVENTLVNLQGIYSPLYVRILPDPLVRDKHVDIDIDKLAPRNHLRLPA